MENTIQSALCRGKLGLVCIPLLLDPINVLAILRHDIINLFLS